MASFVHGAGQLQQGPGSQSLRPDTAPGRGVLQATDPMWKALAVVALLVVSGIAPAAEPLRVGFSSLGKARIGLDEQALAKALGTRLVHAQPAAEEAGCFYASAATLPHDVGLMILDGQLARIDVFEPGLRTVSGAEIGMTEQALKQLYGARLVQSPHTYAEPEGHYLTLMSPDGRHGIRFETDGNVVTGYYAGTARAIQYIEGCQ